FRLIHGGLRYLQSLDIVRLRESVAERSWFLRSFPEHVMPAPCLMPLYGRGLRRNKVMRLALFANDLLSIDRNRGLRPDRSLPAGRILDRAETLQACPGVDSRRLEGAALWWDASMPDSQRLLMEALRWSASAGATALNYVCAEKLLVTAGAASGIEARDQVTGLRHEFHGSCVINAAGPWVRETAAALDRDVAQLFRPTLAWNMLFDRPAPCDYMLALQADDAGAQTFFLQSFKGRLLLGTGHAEWTGSPDAPGPDRSQLEQMLAQVNSALPGLQLRSGDMIRVFAGLLPGRGAQGQQLADRPCIIDHGRQGGVRNLFSVSGVKFTTARKVAETVLGRAVGRGVVRKHREHRRPVPVPSAVWSCSAPGDAGLEPCLPGLRDLIEQEAVVHLDDLVLRRTTLWENRGTVMQLAPRLCDLFPWNEERRRAETDRLAAAFDTVLA
ncbi:MAG TPA: FAD-dependent oxidoreductase, partial [Gammaproteobacteria bacterium]|nr:FAD-dependent oxidoreductase [Gammaproteobacteria bacterium]